MKIDFEITTPERIVYKDEVDCVTIPTMDGEITILPNHIPLISVLKTGELIVKKNNESKHIAISGGFVEVRPQSKVIVLADVAEKSEEIDIELAEEARKRAQKILSQELKDKVEFAEATMLLEKSLTRLKVARKHRKTHRMTDLAHPDR